MGLIQEVSLKRTDKNLVAMGKQLQLMKDRTKKIASNSL